MHKRFSLLRRSQPREEIEFLHALNRAAAALQQSARSEAAVFDAFRREVDALGLQGGIVLLDSKRTRLRLVVVELADQTARQLQQIAALLGLTIEGTEANLADVDSFREVVTTRKAVFAEQDSTTSLQLLPPAARPYAGAILRLVSHNNAIYAPLVTNEICQGLIFVASPNISAADLPAVAAFANHIAVALENARLLAARQEAESQYRRERDRVQRYLDIAEVILLVLACDGTIQLINRKGCNLLGSSEAALVGSNWFESCVPASNRAEVGRFRQMMAGQQPLLEYAESPVMTRDGEERMIAWHTTLLHDSDGTITGCLSSGQDITERRRAAQALRQSEHRFRAIFNQTYQFTVLLRPDGTVLEANQSLLEFMALPTEEIIGRPLWEMIQRVSVEIDTVDLVRMALERAASGEFFRYELELYTRDGRPCTLDFSIKPVRDDLGHVTLLLAEGRDITERKQASEALRQAQKMESLGMLAGGVAHDFNNLLVAMLGQTSLALAKVGADNPARAHIEKAVTAAERAGDLTRQLLAYSGQSQSQIQPLDLHHLVLQNLHLLEVALPKQVRLVADLGPDPMVIEADQGQIQQVIMNLIINAAEAIGSQSGTVRVVSRRCQLRLDDVHYWQYTNYPLLPGPYVSLTVSDTGSGIDSATLQRIFDPFFSTKMNGRGLGLSAVLGIIRGHNGGLRVTSEVGQGAAFELVFPACEVTPVTVASVGQPLRDGNSQSMEAVLVIDDEAAVREAVADILAAQGIEVLLAADGASGIQTYRKHQDRIRLILLDLSMPGMGGEETFCLLQRINPDVRVLLSSGYARAEVHRRFAGQGLAGFIHKPYSASGLLSIVMQHLQSPMPIKI